jgi:hypothetical protein
MENFKGWLRNAGLLFLFYGLWVSLLFKFSLSILQLLLVGYFDMPKCHQEQFCMWKEYIFSDCKNETKKFGDEIW